VRAYYAVSVHKSCVAHEGFVEESIGDGIGTAFKFCNVNVFNKASLYGLSVYLRAAYVPHFVVAALEAREEIFQFYEACQKDVVLIASAGNFGKMSSAYNDVVSVRQREIDNVFVCIVTHNDYIFEFTIASRKIIKSV